MSSPKARRRQRSTRITVAVALVIIAAAAVLGAVLAGSWGLLAAAAVLGVALGALAVRITHSELMQSRRDANRDRAEQAQAFRDLTAERADEHAEFVAGMEQQMTAHQTTIEELEVALTSAQRRAAETSRKLNAEAKRADLAEAEGESLARRLDDAETRAAEAILRVAELEAELDVAKAELDAVRVELAAWEATPTLADRLTARPCRPDDGPRQRVSQPTRTSATQRSLRVTPVRRVLAASADAARRGQDLLASRHPAPTQKVVAEDAARRDHVVAGAAGDGCRGVPRARRRRCGRPRPGRRRRPAAHRP